MALFKLMVNVTAASMTVVHNFFQRGQLVGCSGSVGPSQVCSVWASLLFTFSSSSSCFSISFSSSKLGGDVSSISNALRVGEYEDVGLGGCEGSLPVDVEREVLELGEDSELIFERIGTALR